MNDFQCVLPVYLPKWNIVQFLQSAGEITVPFLLIDNSPDSYTKGLNIPKEIEVLHYPENLGTSMSWNLGIMRMAKWTLILSCSARFGEGGISRYIEGASKIANGYGFHSPIGGHCHAIGRQMVHEAGLFDNSIFPAYKEDSDYGVRLRALGIEDKMVRYEPKGLHIIASAVAVRSARNLDQRIPEREAYYLAKWGGSEGKEIYKTPFNDPNNPIQYFPQPTWFQNRGLPEWKDYSK